MTEWFDTPQGLSFSCTMCGRCCTGPEGYVLVSDSEVAALAARMGVSETAFAARYTRMTEHGRSLNEVRTEHGYDCVFLDRAVVPGRAVCGVYEQRPAQCRTWPFWKSNLTTPRAWERAKQVCPGMDSGRAYTPVEIRVLRDTVEI